MLNKIGLMTCMVLALMGFSKNAAADSATQTVEYKTANGDIMQSVLSVHAKAGPVKGAIIMVPDWKGVSPFYIQKAEQLAEERYITLVAEVYGKDVRPANNEQAGMLAGKYKNDRPLLRTNIQAAYDYLLTVPGVDPAKIVVMGYCFGGTTAIEMARNGYPLAGVVSFHGGLSNPTPENAKNIKAPLLVLHGADDPLVPPEEVKAFREEMAAANIDAQFETYLGAVHSFTNPSAGNDNSTGVAYNETADKLSWLEFHRFLDKVLK